MFYSIKGAPQRNKVTNQWDYRTTGHPGEVPMPGDIMDIHRRWQDPFYILVLEQATKIRSGWQVVGVPVQDDVHAVYFQMGEKAYAQTKDIILSRAAARLALHNYLRDVADHQNLYLSIEQVGDAAMIEIAGTAAHSLHSQMHEEDVQHVHMGEESAMEHALHTFELYATPGRLPPTPEQEEAAYKQFQEAWPQTKALYAQIVNNPRGQEITHLEVGEGSDA